MDNLNDDNTKKERAAASTTAHKHYKTKRNFKDNSANNQCLKILDWLLEKNSITTSEAREHLDVMSPAARILQLKQAGYLIVTIWETWVSEYGIKHRIARYVLTQKEPVESDNDSEVTQ
jgi:hypothetical protein